MLNEQVTRGYLASIDVFPPLSVEFEFNPDQIEDNKGVRFEAKEGQSQAPCMQYVGGDSRKISFDFQLHGLERGKDPDNPSGVENGIAPVLATLRSFTHPRSDALADLRERSEGQAIVAPPRCLFGFGDRLLECHVVDLSISETQFNRYLVPVRAKVGITLNVVEDPDNALFRFDRARRNALAGRQASLDAQTRAQRLQKGRLL